ncbi:BZ3500_MvSof-1268-A1-R1_Chr11-2g03434 [Microbotryum saponariae]|uniref:Serine/threonine-protein phosphatase n=1 Tax=Microbotryum saponariae TaxID=289078 RepID=A0A2X0MTG2_9BASI|nr:BZ3500_MvSof-1268-A1-R1_Chr11-2g03434 [Microbotryum saponariae]SDA03366.1 BZ3501_MvSof-1269-A2-R1_Chr11g03005 [Microbotryum saponariae]
MDGNDCSSSSTSPSSIVEPATRSLFSVDDSSSPTSALPSTDSDAESDAGSDYSTASSEYIAPLSGHAPDPSIDGSSVDGGGHSSGANGGGIRPESEAELGPDAKKDALRIKSEANALFSASKYRPSLDLYTASLNKNPFDPIVWSNRAAVRLKLEEYGLAIADSTRAIELDARAVKAYFRRAIANLAIMKPKAALVDLKKVISLDPNNASAKAQLDATQKLLRRLQFEAAISAKDEVLTSTKILEQLAHGALPIEASYAGPRLLTEEEGKALRPTSEFVDELIEWFRKGETIPKRLAWQIVLGAYEKLKEEKSLVKVTIPQGETMNVYGAPLHPQSFCLKRLIHADLLDPSMFHSIGDTHGQFYDFYHLLTLTGRPSETHSLLFNGDFVDRGSWSTEIVLVLFAYKWLYPTKVFLNRGNHETADMNKVYGFEGETKKKYSEMTYKLFEEVFTALPLATLISASSPTNAMPSDTPKNPILCQNKKRYFVVHGGLFSRDDVTLANIAAIDRISLKQPGHEGLMCEMLWTDPQDTAGRGPSKRGVGIGFGPDVTRRWCELNQVTAVMRSHEVRQGGYSVEHDGLCITVFSAPNYVDQVGNLAAFATIDETGSIKYTTFKEQPHPNIKPMAYAGQMAMM